MDPVCVVCARPSDVYCHNDNAYLCHGCDAHVHSAHAIASTHRRTPVDDASVPSRVPSEEVDGVVPQDFLPFGEKVPKDELRDMDLSLSDDAWFTVPDTACSNARGPSGHGKSAKTKDFGYDDLFEFDAALDDDLPFALDRVSSDLLADCLVPDADVLPQHEVAQSTPVKTLSEELLGSTPRTHVEESAPSAPAATPYHPPAPARAPMPSPPAYSYCVPVNISDSVPNLDCYIPQSLLPVDPVARQHLLADRREKVERFREKKNNRQFKKLIRYASRKRYAEVRPRIKGRFARKDEIAAAAAAGTPLTA